MSEFRTLLTTLLHEQQIRLSPGQIDQLACHWELVEETNRKFNLTAISGNAAASLHYVDSLLALPLLEQAEPHARLLDIGSGAGFPGIPLAVARPDLQVFLLESTAKKCDFLTYCAQYLHLDNVEIVAKRAEEAGRSELRGSFDVVTARAVANLATLAEYALPLLKQGGFLLAMKGSNWQQELAEAKAALQQLGGEFVQAEEQHLPGGESRATLLISKAKPTAEKFPRRTGIPAKKPLK